MSEKMREEFEAWARFDPNGCGRISRSHEPGREEEYEDSHTNLCWRAWKASRESLVVDFTYCVLPHEFVEAAKDSGLKVKP